MKSETLVSVIGTRWINRRFEIRKLWPCPMPFQGVSIAPKGSTDWLIQSKCPTIFGIVDREEEEAEGNDNQRLTV